MTIQHSSQIIKGQETVVYLGECPANQRPTAAVSDSGVITLSNQPTMKYLTGVTNASVSINDTEQEYYLLGGNGFADAVTTTTRAQASITTYFQRDIDGSDDSATLQSNGYDEALSTALKCRNKKDLELWVEIYKQLGTNLNYDVTCFAARLTNYSESYPADNLVEVTFDLMSRGPVSAGTLTLSASKMPTAPN